MVFYRKYRPQKIDELDNEVVRQSLYSIFSKENYPHFKLRLNYTINNLNLNELNDFFKTYGLFQFDILQLRALRDIGGEIQSVENNDSFNTELSNVVLNLKKECKNRNIFFMPPDSFDKPKSGSKEVKNFSYGYISPKTFIHDDFDWRNETFNQFSKRTHYSFKLLKSLFE